MNDDDGGGGAGDCDCGGEREVKGVDLRSGRVTDCIECTYRRKRKLEVLQALYLVGPPPCEKKCTLMKHCETRELACKIFFQWVQQKGPLRDADPDPARYMPSREIYREIFRGK